MTVDPTQPLPRQTSSRALYQRRRAVFHADVDELGHVNNVVWLRFVVDLAVAHSGFVGLDLAAYREIGGVWVARRHEIEYLGPAWEGDEILEQTWLSRMHGATALRQSRFRAADGVLLVRARTEWAFVGAANQRPTRIPPAVRDAFAPIDGTDDWD